MTHAGQVIGPHVIIRGVGRVCHGRRARYGGGLLLVHANALIPLHSVGNARQHPGIRHRNSHRPP